MSLNPQNIGFLVNFSAIFGCDTHFESELRRSG